MNIYGGSVYIEPYFLDLGIIEVGGYLNALAVLPPGNKPLVSIG
jgi:hypothetical protein